MNDLHVVALLYQVNHDESINYRQAEQLIHEETNFLLEVKDNQARFEMKEHYATEKDARDSIENYIRNWESHACLERNSDCFRLEFEKAEIEDRNPTHGVKSLRANAKLGALKSSASLTIAAPRYPTPPSGVNFNNPDVQTMYRRYMDYHRGNEKLPGMANFCLTLLENMAGPKTRRKAAAEKFQISKKVLDKIAMLSSNKGGQDARKAEGIGKEFTNQERAFLEQAIKKIIRRAAEKVQNRDNNLPKITLSALPPI